MRATFALCSAARTPLIRFVGKRSVPSTSLPHRTGTLIPRNHQLTSNSPESVDHTPRVHPASPIGALPDSFAAYRAKAQQHGPLGRSSSSGIGGSSGHALGPIRPQNGQFFDRTELPARFGRLTFTEAEMEAIETGGASMYA
jgi:small subunit ribosomal protein YMR-31